MDPLYDMAKTALSVPLALRSYRLAWKLIRRLLQNTCKYIQSELAKELNISPSTVSRYLKQAEDSGYIKRDDKGIHLKDRKMFIITSETPFAFAKNVYTNILTDEDIAERKIHNYNE